MIIYTPIMIALSIYILVHPFWAIYKYSPQGNIVFHVGSLYDFGFGLGRVPHQHGSTLLIKLEWPGLRHAVHCITCRNQRFASLGSAHCKAPIIM